MKIYEPADRAPTDPPRARILLVEDNEAARRGLAKLLSAQGYRVTSVDDGRSALEALQAIPPHDFVITDLQLPDLDGRDVASAALALSPPPRVGAITGWDFEDVQAPLSGLGVDWVLTKPINLLELLHKLEDALDDARRPPETARPPDPEGTLEPPPDLG